MTLYELTASAAELYELLQNDEIDEQTVSDTLEGMGIDEKLEGCCKVVSQFNADILALKEEEERLNKKRKTAESGAKRIRANLLNYLETTGKKKATAGLFTISARSGKKVKITDETILPKSVLAEQPPKISRTEIKKLLDSGVAVAGAELEISTTLQIK